MGCKKKNEEEIVCVLGYQRFIVFLHGFISRKKKKKKWAMVPIMKKKSDPNAFAFNFILGPKRAF